METGRYVKYVFHFGSCRSIETATGVISKVIDLFGNDLQYKDE